MRIAYVCRSDPHAHDYGVDWLFEGLCDVQGFENVFDLPERECLHLSSPGARDECQIDSDQCWPRKNVAPEDVKPALIILTALDRGANEIMRRLPKDTLVAAVDMHDALENQRRLYDQVAGRPVSWYFKRECPIAHGARGGALPLPLTYSSKGIPWLSGATGRIEFIKHPSPIVFYHATDHGGGPPGIPRRQIVEDLTALAREYPATTWDVNLYPGQGKGTRPSPEEYHEYMAKALIGISWNGAPNWDCNRFWENFAYGLAQVAERPRIAIPDMPEDRKHVLYVDQPGQVVDGVRWLLEQPERVAEIASAGFEHFHRFHSAKRRAMYLLNQIHQDCVRD